MSEVKPADIKLVTDALGQYLNHVIQTKNIDLREFVNLMEPVFKKAGYREPKTSADGCNILITHDSGTGDFITHSGVIREIRRLYPTAHITLVVVPSGFQFAECCPYVDEVIRNPNPPHNLQSNFIQNYLLDMQFLYANLLKTRFDICYSFPRYASTPILMYMSGSRIRISHIILERNPDLGYSVPQMSIPYTSNLSTHVVPPYKFGNHCVDANFALVDNFLHVPVANRELEVWYTPAEFSIAKNLVSNFPRPLYALSIGGSGAKRRYPAEKFAALVKMILSEDPTATFINLGGGQNDAISAQILYQQLGAEIFNKHIVNLVGRSNFRIDAAIMSFCDMYIGNNTGPMWLACATKCPVLVAECFPKDLDTGHLDIPRLYGPYKVPAVSVQPKHALPECKINKPYHPYGCRANIPHCITQIQPETLFKGFKLLKEKIAKKIIDTTYIC